MGFNFEKKGSVGGRSGTAKAGAFNPGPSVVAQVGGDKPGQHKDLRGGMPASGGYKQGPTVVAQAKSGNPGVKDLRPMSAPAGKYGQGNQF